jgi:hypothetical protein
MICENFFQNMMMIGRITTLHHSFTANTMMYSTMPTTSTTIASLFRRRFSLWFFLSAVTVSISTRIIARSSSFRFASVHRPFASISLLQRDGASHNNDNKNCILQQQQQQHHRSFVTLQQPGPPSKSLPKTTAIMSTTTETLNAPSDAGVLPDTKEDMIKNTDQWQQNDDEKNNNDEEEDEKLRALRQLMKDRNIDVYLIPSDDPHLSGM